VMDTYTGFLLDAGGGQGVWSRTVAEIATSIASPASPPALLAIAIG